MKKGILLSLLLLTITSFITGSIAQTRPKYFFGHYFHFKFITTDKRMKVRSPTTFTAQDSELYRVLDFIKENKYSVDENIQPLSPIMLGVKLNPNLEKFNGADVKSLTKTYSSYVISDSSAATLIAVGITPENVKDYKYRVIENDSVELIPWTKIPRTEQNYGAKQPYGFIGNFNYPGKQILVEVQNTKNYSIRDGVIFDWRVNFKPVVNEITVSTPDDGKRISFFNLNYDKMNRGYATRFDPVTGIPLNFKFPVDSVDEIRLNFKSHTTVPYSIYLIKTVAGKTDTTTLNIYTQDNLYDIERKQFDKPGKYEIIIQRNEQPGAWPESQLLRIPFEVKPPPPTEKKASLKQALPYIIATLSGGALLFYIYYRRNKVKLQRAAREKQVAGLKLKSIRAQLNPHFMFNALTSIQNLVNKNDLEGANHYLSKFAELTRQVLDSGNEDLLSLKQELEILDDYLQMEQLRFGFKYEISVADSLNRANIEIPAMLLQPFVENAVKHGIATLREKGLIKINVIAVGKDLVFSITDNGKGFESNKPNENAGYGLKLSEERVALLNQVYKDQAASLQIDSGEMGTTISIRLSTWI